MPSEKESGELALANSPLCWCNFGRWGGGRYLPFGVVGWPGAHCMPTSLMDLGGGMLGTV